MRSILFTSTATLFGEQWLRQNQNGYGALDEEDRSALREFAVLWAIFESQTLFGKGGPEAIINYVDEFADQAESEDRKLLTAPFIPHLTYFRQQFVDVEHTDTNDDFDQLRFEQQGHKDLVSHALIKLHDDTPELVKALLIIVHRLKDGLFRSLKWQQMGKKMKDDLYHASKILMKATDMSRP